MDFVGTILFVLETIVVLEPSSDEGNFVELDTNFVTVGIAVDGTIVELASLGRFTL